MSLRRKHSRLHLQLAQYGAIAALGAFAIGAKRPGAPVVAPVAAAHAPVVGGYVTLARGAHPLARPEHDIGRLDPDKQISNLSLVFKLSAQQTADRDALLEAVINPASPSYHQWLTPESYAARFGAKPNDIARASAWLTSQGLQVHAEPSRLGARVTFSGTVRNLEAAFRSEMHQYKIGSKTHFAMASAPAIPADLADIVLAVHNTHDFYPHPMTTAKAIPASLCPNGTTGIFCDQVDAGAGKAAVGQEGIAPPDWSAIYDVAPLYTTGIGGNKITGTGVTIAIVGISQVAQSDISAFWTAYGITAANITQTVVPGTGAMGEQGGAGIEAILDTEWASSLAPGANISYVLTGVDDGNVDDATYYAIEQNLGGILSESWGGCEGGETPADADVLQTFGSAASLMGITYLASSGDQGATSCEEDVDNADGESGGLYVNIPAAYPGVTSVGGTGFASPAGLSFTASHIASGYGTESIWNEGNDPASGVGAGGGGISVVFARPSYQANIPTCDITGALPVSGITASAMRQVPDLALTAASGQSQYGYFIECTPDQNTDDCSTTGGNPYIIEIGGTSASTPSFAGIVALAGQATGGRFGNLNPLLYSLPSTVFHDVTIGNNIIGCKVGTDPGCPSTGAADYGYSAATGFDCASGLGSIDATKFVTAIAGLAPTTTTLAAVTSPLTEGTPVPLTATVTGTTAPTGTVTFEFESYLANGQLDLSWPLGTATISGGTASPATPFPIPPGLAGVSGGVDLVAMYGGDTTHLPSQSAKQHVTFKPVTLCATPGTVSVAAGASLTVSASGGVLPAHYFMDVDTTSVMDDAGAPVGGSTFDETTGKLTVGTGQAGYVLIQTVDSAGAETYSEITVGAPTDPAPWAGDSGLLVTGCGGSSGDGGVAEGGAGGDAGTGTGGQDSGLVSEDGGGEPSDGSASNPGTGSSSSGCNCTTTGRSDGAPAGAFGGLVLGLGLIARRRRARR